MSGDFINKAIISGYVGQDPRIINTRTGKKMATFSVATTEKWKNKKTGEWCSKSEWHNIVVMDENLVKIVSDQVFKGSKVHVEGKIQSSKYTDKNGNERSSTQIAVNSFDGKIVVLQKTLDLF